MGVEVRPSPPVERSRATRGAPGPGRAAPAEGAFEVDDPDGPVGQAILQATRLRLLALLSSEAAHARGGYSLQELRDLIGCSAQNVHHHLRVLVDAGAVFLARSEATHNVPRQYWCSHVRRIRVHVQTRAPDPAFSLELAAGAERSETERRLLERCQADGALRTLVDAGVVRALERLPADERVAVVEALGRMDEGLRDVGEARSNRT